MTQKDYRLWEAPETVAEFMDLLSNFPGDWPVKVVTPAGGGIAVEHREIDGIPVVAVFGKNGGRIGQPPLTEEEYRFQSRRFMDLLNSRRYRYTSVHGDHRLYSVYSHETVYGKVFDRRVVERMVAEGLYKSTDFDIARVQQYEASDANQKMYENKAYMKLHRSKHHV